jgi:recombination protein RecA
MSQALRKITGACAKANAVVIFINQIRMKIGVFYGSPETTSGGQALKFFSSVRLDVRKREPIKANDSVIGNETSVRVVKNKCAPPLKEARFELLFGRGINRLGEIVDAAVDLGVVQKSGSWFTYGDEKIGQGRNNAISHLRENDGVLNEVEKKVLEIIYG